MRDPIVEEVRRHRDELASKYNYNIRSICDASRLRQKTCGHKVVDLSKSRKTGRILLEIRVLSGKTGRPAHAPAKCPCRQNVLSNNAL